MSPIAAVVRVPAEDFDWSAPQGAAERVREVVASATAADGTAPLDEATTLSLRHAGLTFSSLWVSPRPEGRGGHSSDAGSPGEVASPAAAPGRVASPEVPRADDEPGYGGPLAGFVLVNALPGERGEVEANLVVAPEDRGQGVGRALAEAALTAQAGAGATGSGPTVSAWSHGNHPGAAALAATLGFARVRDLWVMRRSLRDDLPPLRDADEVDVRPFRPGEDEQAFLAVNAAAFAHHPEQGEMTLRDLEQRMAEPWFDPAGFFVATSRATGEVLGFHWTKVHPEGYGEVYVVGVSPAAQGMGLGRTLTLTGLHHLRDSGLAEVILYVEADNAAAVRVYSGLGFTHADADTHVMYRRAG